jgi:hypothetical protein
MNAGDREAVNVPMDLYEKACINDVKQGIEVRFYL